MRRAIIGARGRRRGFGGLICSLIWFIQVQAALNRYWQSKGAPPP